MKRRSFLKSSSFISVPMLLNGLPLSTLGSQSTFDSINNDNDNILVLIQLNGGNDGLNTLIPLDHYDLLANVRSNVIIPKNKILEMDDILGMHPNLQGIKGLYDDGRMSVIRDVGYPNQNRSHFRSSDIWTSGSPSNENWTTGWLGRKLQNDAPAYPENYPNADSPDPFALSIGSNISSTCQGTITNFSLALADPTSIGTLSTSTENMVPDSAYGRELAFIRTTIKQTNAYGEVITAAADKGSNSSITYPDSSLANQLRSIALLISGGLKTKVYVANLGGFDTHANQVVDGDTTAGNHALLMDYLSSAVAAFQADLRAIGKEQKVVTMTFSEFGRRIRSNDSNGTDHGSAAPMMLFGSCVNPGIIGSSSALHDTPSQSDGVPFQFDFRDVYGSVLKDWFEVEETEVRSILHDDFNYIPLISRCETTATSDPIINVQSHAVPNPFENWTTIHFKSDGGHTRISVFNALGYEVEVISSQKYAKGEHKVKYDGSSLPTGNYFYRIQSSNGVSTQSIVKI